MGPSAKAYLVKGARETVRALRTKAGFHKPALSRPHPTSDNKASLRPLTEKHEWLLVPSCDALGVVVKCL